MNSVKRELAMELLCTLLQFFALLSRILNPVQHNYDINDSWKLTVNLEHWAYSESDETLMHRYMVERVLWDQFNQSVPSTQSIQSTQKTFNTARVSFCKATFTRLLLLSGDIHCNPGPFNKQTCSRNYGLRSVNHEKQVKITTLQDLRYVKGIRCAHLNVCSLPPKLDELRIMLKDLPIDILSLNETWLDESFDDSELHVQGYNLHRTDRNRHGGGTLLYISEKFNFIHRSDIQTPELEATWIQLNLPKTKPIIISSVYRPPNFDMNEFTSTLESILHTVSETEVIILGDLNCDMHKPRNIFTQKLKQVCGLFNLENLINLPTRVTENTSTCIDLILTNHSEKISQSGVISLGMSDHSLVYAVRKLRRPGTSESKYISTRSYKSFDQSAFLNDISEVRWPIIDDINIDVNTAWDEWKSLFVEICDRHAPMRTMRVRVNQPDWITSEYHSLRHDRDQARVKAEKSKDKQDWNRAKKLRNKCNEMLLKLKKQYISDQVKENKDNPKGLWKTLKKLLPPKVKSDIRELSVDGNLQSKPANIANILNDYFATIGEKLAATFTNTLSYVFNNNEQRRNFTFTPITKKFVLNELKRLNANKATGIDGIPARLLKTAAPRICESLSEILNLSIQSTEVANEWKTAIVTPIFKDGNKADCSNYRPISVIPVTMKILERAVHNQLYKYFQDNNILCKNQHGFRPKHSTTTALTLLTDQILWNMDKGLITGGIFLDLSKAFDTVDHKTLLHKLQSYGVKGSTLEWFNSYLSNRQQRTKVNNTISDSRAIAVGVPQGSILGPLLFVIYVNDLPLQVQRCKMVLYADDTAIFYAAKSMEEVESVLVSEMNKIEQWLQCNKLTLNASKSKYMLFGTTARINSTQDLHIQVKGTDIKRTSAIKYLGLWLDENLTWSTYIDKLCKNVSRRLSLLSRVRRFIDIKTLNLLYNALVLPKFDYCDVVWSNCNQTMSQKLQRLQNRAGRIITGTKLREFSSAKIRKRLKWTELSARRDFHLSLFTFKCLNDLAPPQLKETFIPVKSIHDHRTRSTSNNHLYIPKPRIMAGKKTFTFRAIKLWNTLPLEIRQCQKLWQFRMELSKHT